MYKTKNDFLSDSYKKNQQIKKTELISFDGISPLWLRSSKLFSHSKYIQRIPCTIIILWLQH